MEAAVQVNGSFGHLCDIAAIAEEHRFGAIALADHYVQDTDGGRLDREGYDALLQAAALARETTRIGITMLVSPVTFRHPAVYAKAATTIDAISRGRFSLGLGAGSNEKEHTMLGLAFPERSERFARLEEALAYLRAYIDTPEAGYRGDRFSFEGHAYQPPLRKSFRLVVGGSGKHTTPRLAGSYADEFNVFSTDVEKIRARVATMRQAAENAGRDPTLIAISCGYRMFGGNRPSEIEDFFRAWGERQERDPGHLRRSLEGRVNFLTWEQHAERLATLAAAGFDRVYIKGVVESADAFGRAAPYIERALA